MTISVTRKKNKQFTLNSLAVLAGFSFATASHACTLSHTVDKGDTLSQIASEHLGNIFAYEAIYEANRQQIGSNPNRIKVGMTLNIPCAEGDGTILDWSVMPRPESLAQLMQTEDIQILDIRGVKQLKNGVIPSAFSVPYASWSGPKDNPGAPPTEEALASLIGGAGLDLNKPIIIVHNKPNMMDIGRAAKIYWLLKSSGATSLAILRDGHSAWVKQGLPVADAPRDLTPIPPIQVSFSTQWRADLVDVYGVATDQVDGYLLDARPHNMFARINDLGQAIGSTLPGARNTPVKSLMDVLAGSVDVEDGVDEVVAFLREHNVDWTEKQVISFCHSGELAALNWFYASEVAKLDNMKLFPESVKGWQHLGGALSIGTGG
ncbi:MAG: rhodanese-like domain-containing protein [Pseudomonadota bacterium]